MDPTFGSAESSLRRRQVLGYCRYEATATAGVGALMGGIIPEATASDSCEGAFLTARFLIQVEGLGLEVCHGSCTSVAWRF